MWPIGFSDTDFEEAVDWFREQLAIPDEEMNRLRASARQRAFRVAGVAQLDLVTDVWRALDRAIAEGTTLRDFADEVGESLKRAWAGTVVNPGARLDLIFRTNLQSAYGAGRYAHATDPVVRAARPFWLFDAVVDDRTTIVCRACDGTILPADDPFWATHIPPLHFDCRSTFVTLSEEQAAERGVSQAPPREPAMKGFGTPPRSAEWTPSREDYPPDLWEEFSARSSDPPPSPKRAETKP